VLDAGETETAGENAQTSAADGSDDAAVQDNETADKKKGAEVVHLDAFRKK